MTGRPRFAIHLPAMLSFASVGLAFVGIMEYQPSSTFCNWIPGAVIRRNCRLSVIDHRKLDKQLDQEAGKMLLRHNRSFGTLKSNRLLMRRRLESMLAHALSIPIFSPNMNVSDLYVQQLIDKAPTIAKSCVVSSSPDALLQGVVALPPLFTACVGPDIRRDHVVICNADET
jgi:hypothetical protein